VFGGQRVLTGSERYDVRIQSDEADGNNVNFMQMNSVCAEAATNGGA